MATIEDVRQFWSENPLFAGEIAAPVGSPEWFHEVDQIELNDVCAGDLSLLVNPSLKGKRVLEVGCGPGFLARQMAKAGIDYTGIDLAPRSIELASAGQRLSGLPGTFEVGNGEALEFPDESFDHVVSIGVIHHTPDPRKCIDEIHRVLKKGGTAAVAVYHRNWLLRNPPLLRLAQAAMRVFNLGLRGRGREKIASARDAQELVRMYDGHDNPIGRAFTRAELTRMFENFEVLGFQSCFFPARALPVTLPRRLHAFLARRMGFLILVHVRK